MEAKRWCTRAQGTIHAQGRRGKLALLSWRRALQARRGASKHAPSARSSLHARITSTTAARSSLLRGAAARSGGQLAVLNADNCDRLTEAALLDVLTANAGSLLVLSWCASFLRFAAVEALVRAAPQLRILEVEAGGSVAEAVRMLRNEPPFGALQLRTVIASHARGGDGALEEVHAIAGAVTRQAALKCLVVHDFQLNTAAPLDTVMTAV